MRFLDTTARWYRLGGLVLTGAVVVALAPAASAVITTKAPDRTWQTNDRVRAVVYAGDTVYLGGSFSAVRPPGTAADSSQAVPRSRVAAFDRTTGAVRTDWKPALDGTVWAMAASPDGNTIYVAGDFVTVNGATRKKVAAVSAATGALLSWNPRPNGRVRAILASADGQRVYIGGKFTTVNGEIQNLLAAVNSPATGSKALVAGWRPTVAQVAGEPCPPRCTPEVASLALSSDGTGLYVGGHFGLLNGVNRNNVGELAVSDGGTMAWDPNVFAQNPVNPNQKNFVYGIAPSPTGVHNSRVFFCGDFFRVGGKGFPNLAAVHPVTGALDPGWTTTDDGGTPACALSGSHLYIGGHFNFVGFGSAPKEGLSRRHVAAIDADTGTIADWNPGANSVLGLHALAVSGGNVAAAGDFTRIGGVDQQGFAQFSGTP